MDFHWALVFTTFTPSNFSLVPDLEVLTGVAETIGLSTFANIDADLTTTIDATSNIAIAALINIPLTFMIVCLIELFFLFENIARKIRPHDCCVLIKEQIEFKKN